MATGVTQQQQQLQTQMMSQTTMVASPTMVQYQQPQQVFQTPMGMQQAGMTMTSMTGAMGATSVAMPTALGGTQRSWKVSVSLKMWHLEHCALVMGWFYAKSVTQTQRDFRRHFNISQRGPILDHNTIFGWIRDF
ncbi:hypothetical protein C0J52_04929 [Blattella germanica]|nr:hypothetical protein C0J52_04929 [Blattella germanica]